MTSDELFAKTPPTRLFFKAAIPGAIGMLAAAFYQTFDGIFVGQYLGTTAFVAVNLAMPFVVINFAVSDLIGVGSSVVISLLLGRGERAEANSAFTCSVLLGVDHLRERGARLPARAPRGAEPARAHGHLAQLPRHGRALRAALDGCARGNAHGDANRTARMRSAIITRAPRRLQTDHRRRGRQGRLWEVAPARLRRGAHDPPRSGRGGRGAPRTWASRSRRQRDRRFAR